ncbi:carbohydrate ABC transporter permease [Mucisphaera calidilacus]|uniref:sn-glycerol-3-phosphate transport system permease protein UgpA n=1 Tax=Mucisphaera calidilacus TaxID=2527982 RepID=A0A518BUE3_9BACT|nr:sugar ABC transporter permease [Mucisphaera calidilacus]QDU70554.1 sn-glycerol-3-phosphate transport system permease protein UgpA [Mucisphaera calidilacus]
MPATRNQKNQRVALAFLAPNLAGVLVFTLYPVVFSLVMAFTNWDLTRHNQFQDENSIRFIGFKHFLDMVAPSGEGLFAGPFWQYLGNTLFFMMGIPLAVVGSLMAALLLTQQGVAPRYGRLIGFIIASAGLIASVAIMVLYGSAETGTTLLFVGFISLVLVGGLTFGTTWFRTLFYTPHFVAGVATYILWKKLYSRDSGPINQVLQPALDGFAATVNAVPPALVTTAGWALALIAIILGYLCSSVLARNAARRVLPRVTLAVCLLLLAGPLLICLLMALNPANPIIGIVTATALILTYAGRLLPHLAGTLSVRSTQTGDPGLMVMLIILTAIGQALLLGLALVFLNLPAMAADGLDAPSWLNDPNFAKPALMIMVLWAAIGSNNMLLYLAALTNVPKELHEAASIDGASALQRFWSVTLPELAPTTFFIFVTSTIYGLQGGFEMARVMTEGGPAGATTTLSYFIYQEGFQAGRLGSASAIAWMLFLLIFGVTVINWRYGGRSDA